jgi:hypothetical protein
MAIGRLDDDLMPEIKLGPYDVQPVERVNVPPEPADEEKMVKTRYVVAFLGFLGFVVTFMVRININLAIVDMVVSNQSTVAGGKEADRAHQPSRVCSHILFKRMQPC